MRVIGIIPARGGSKGVPRKNIRLLGGKPLLQYTAETGLAARRLARVVLSTEDEEIAAIGRACGLDVPFLRPLELAQDDTPTVPVVLHAARQLEQLGDSFDAICLLQPTTPFRPAEDIDRCIDLLSSSGADAVATVATVPPEHNPHWVYFQDQDGALRLSTGEATPISRRQDLPSAFCRDGSVYVVRTEVLYEHENLYGNRFLGCVVDRPGSVNIDVAADWDRAEQTLAHAATTENHHEIR